VIQKVSRLTWQNVGKYHLFTSTRLILQLVKTFFHLVENTKISANVGSGCEN
jgi:hypothetical protein